MRGIKLAFAKKGLTNSDKSAIIVLCKTIFSEKKENRSGKEISFDQSSIP